MKNNERMKSRNREREDEKMEVGCIKKKKRQMERFYRYDYELRIVLFIIWFALLVFKWSL